LDNKNTRRKFW